MKKTTIFFKNVKFIIYALVVVAALAERLPVVVVPAVAANR